MQSQRNNRKKEAADHRDECIRNKERKKGGYSEIQKTHADDTSENETLRNEEIRDGGTMEGQAQRGNTRGSVQSATNRNEIK